MKIQQLIKRLKNYTPDSEVKIIHSVSEEGTTLFEFKIEDIRHTDKQVNIYADTE